MKLIDFFGKTHYLEEILNSKSLNSASIKLRISQPQLTRVIKEIEDTLGTPLIMRSYKGIQLTHAGKLMQNLIREISKEINQLERQLSIKFSEKRGIVRIGTYDSICRYIFTDFLKHMSQVYPHIVSF